MSVLKFSLSEMNVNFFSEVMKRTILVMLASSMEVGTVSVLHIETPVKSSLDCITHPWINPVNDTY